MNNGSTDNEFPNRTHAIMSPEDVANGKKPRPWTRLVIEGQVKNLSPTLWNMTHLTVLYMNRNNIQRLPPEISKLENLRVLDLSNNKLRSLPPEIGDLTELRELYLCENNLRSLPYEFGKLFRLKKLSLKGNPLSSDLLQLYKEPVGLQKLLAYLLDILTMQHPLPRPPQRPWILVDQPADRSKPSCMFTVMCYNVLCDKYATRQLYGYCPTWALKWEYRKQAILEELRTNSADVIALQEVETEQYQDYFLKLLRAEGYEGIFSPKSRAKTMSGEERKHVDGCAIFYRTSKFSLISEHLIEFNQLAMANAQGSDDMLNRVMTKDNIALAALLQIKEDAFESLNTGESASLGRNASTPTDSIAPGSKLNTNINSTGTSLTSSSSAITNNKQQESQNQLHQQRLLVCTAHIHWDPEFCDVKLIQSIMLTHELQAIANQAAKDLVVCNGQNLNTMNNSSKTLQQNNLNKPQQQEATNNIPDFDINSLACGDNPRQEQLGSELVPIILCGDFNSLPESGVYEFLSNGCISADHGDFKELAYKDCLRRICSAKASALSNSQHSQQQNQSQYSGQPSSVTNPLPYSVLSSSTSASSSSVDEQHQNSSFDDLLNNGNGGQRKLKNGVNHMNTPSFSDIDVNSYTHNLCLASAYVGEGRMPFTNYTSDFRGVIDYIFYSKNLMSVLGVSGYDKSWLDEHKVPGLPHPYFSSDHFPLFVELEILPTPRSMTSRFKSTQYQPHQQSMIQNQQHNKNDFFQNPMRKPFFGT